MLTDIIRLCRPQQWLKNLFVFLPIFFSGNFLHISLLLYTLTAFFSFALASSAIYSLNDLIDKDADAIHPVKCRRPIASGRISSRTALSLTLILSLAALALPFLIPGRAALFTSAIIALYILLNIAYCLGLKRIAIVDVIIVALGFVLRVAAGGTATSIAVSHWIIIMTFLLALFLALCKRRDDSFIYETSGKKMRHNIDMYSPAFISQTITLVATIMLVSYIMYTVSPEVVARFHSDLIYITSIFVLAGILRYMQLTTVYKRSGSPTRVLLHDRFTQACIIAWLLTFTLIIYL